MLYYRMTNKHDCYYPHKNITIVYNELKTGKELEKLNICKDSACFERIYTSKKNTYFVFGCRFVRDENKVFQERKTMKDLCICIGISTGKEENYEQNHNENNKSQPQKIRIVRLVRGRV